VTVETNKLAPCHTDTSTLEVGPCIVPYIPLGANAGLLALV